MTEQIRLINRSEPEPIKRSGRARRAGLLTTLAAVAAVAFASGHAIPSNDPVRAQERTSEGPVAGLSTPTTSFAGAGTSGIDLATTSSKFQASEAISDKVDHSILNSSVVKEDGTEIDIKKEFNGKDIVEGTYVAVQAGDVISGDVSMSDILTKKVSERLKLYDTDDNKRADITDTSKTALIVVVDQPGFVYADKGNNGATLYRNLTKDQLAKFLDRTITQNTRQKNDDGSVGREVDTIEWKGQANTIQQKDVPAPVKPEIVLDLPSNDPELKALLDGTDPILKSILETDLSTLTLDQKIEIEKLKIDLKNLNISVTEEQLLAEIQKCSCSACQNKTAQTPCPEADHPMKKGEVYTLTNGDRALIQGDAIIDPKFDDKGNYIKGSGIKTYDDSEKTGSISKILDGKVHVIYAKEGGLDVQEFCPATDIKLITDKWFKDDVKNLREQFVKDANGKIEKDKNGKPLHMDLDNKSKTIN